MVENHHNLKENLMLKEKDKIFKNLYGFEDWKLEGAKKRGIWSNTKELIKMGSEKIIEEIKNSQLRGRGGAGESNCGELTDFQLSHIHIT